MADKIETKCARLFTEALQDSAMRQRLSQRLSFTLKTLLIFLSSVWIWGCSGNFVNQSIVREGISLYLDYTQTALSESLHLPPPTFQVKDLHIEDQQVFLHDRLPTYHVQGHYTLRLKFPTQTLTQSGNPFDLYLQEQAENKTWRLLLPASADSDQLDLWQSLLVTPAQ